MDAGQAKQIRQPYRVYCVGRVGVNGDSYAIHIYLWRNAFRKDLLMFNWDNAPKWAQWVAMDESLEWYWYEFKPTLDDYGSWEQNGRFKMIVFDDIDYGNTLEERP